MKLFSKFLLTALLALIVSAGTEAKEKSLKILTIGNSFSNSVIGSLHKIVQSDPESKLLLKRASLGGCTLQRHWQEHLKAEKDPQYKVYRNDKNKNSLTELLKAEKWDIVTIQQASPVSWQEKSYEPYAANLIALIRKNAPTAEIIIQQTWSYNASSGRLKKWKIDQKQMYEKIQEAYAKLAQRYKLRVIPSGLAVQIYREKLGKKVIKLDMEGQYTAPKAPVTTDLAGYGMWRKNKKTGKQELLRDTIHLNADGRYMQACVWFGFLYGKDPAAIKYVPAKMSKERAALLRQCASEAIAQYKQAAK